MMAVQDTHGMPKLKTITGPAFACLAAAMCLAACSSKSASSLPSDPTPTPVPGSTITITSTGVSPKSLQVSPVTRVLFVNNSSFSPLIFSDPHPEHTDCPEINNVGFIGPSQSKETGNLNTVRTCGYHDHDHPDDARLKG